MSGNGESTPAIAVRNLHRVFFNVHAVQGVSFEVPRGQVVGFIGANGAGKTTTMRIMATLDTASAGTVEVCGHDVQSFPDRVRASVGWMPDHYGTYEHMTVLEYLDFFGRASGLKGRHRLARLEEVMDFTDLAVLADRPMNSLSKGMGQRLCLGRTLLHDPGVLILDEPAAGLDPKARIEFKRLVRLLATQGKTVFISSHILSELGEMCDSLLFIDNGRIVHHGTAESLQEHSQAGAGEARAQILIDVQVAGDPEPLRNWAPLQQGVKLIEMRKRGARLALESDEPEAIASLLRRLIQDGFAVTDFHRESRRLEDAFVDLLKKGHGNFPPPPPPPPHS